MFKKPKRMFLAVVVFIMVGVLARLIFEAHPRPPLQARTSPATMPFEDATRRAGLEFTHDPGEMGELFIAETMGGGVGLIDYDGDGWLDVYFINGCRLPSEASAAGRNRLYRNNRDGTFVDVTARAGVPGRGYGMGCAVGDYDNDDDDDLFITGMGQTILYRNEGDGRFSDVTREAGVASSLWTTAAGFADLDSDGDLDLVVVTYVDADPKRKDVCSNPRDGRTHCPPRHYPSQFDILFRNNGDGTFADVSREAGLEALKSPGLGLAIADFDDDGRLDIFVANDTEPNELYKNLGGLRFEDVAIQSGVAYNGRGEATASMGVVADDLDGDGLIDLFHTNFIRETNTFLKNFGGGQFGDASATSGLGPPSVSVTGFGAAALDIGNDGTLDLIIANGHVDDLPKSGMPMAQLPHLYVAHGALGHFILAPSSIMPYFAQPSVGRGVAAGDLDNDGRVDFVIVHRGKAACLMRQVGISGHWLGVSLRGRISSRTPVGAKVSCHYSGGRVVRWITSGTSYLAANDMRAWFGLGSSTHVERLEVRWPSGLVQTWHDVAVDQIVEVVEGEGLGVRQSSE